MFSIITPLDPDRLDLYKETKKVYDSMPQRKEFIIPTRNEEVVRQYLHKFRLDKDVVIIPYTVEVGFNCSKALNLGVKKAKYSSIIITSPEVKPTTPVLSELEKLLGQNVICQVWDENINGSVGKSLVKHFRSKGPGKYFLAMFNKSDIESINGWDEDFMKGYAYEDNDFGERWVRANIPFMVRLDIQALHQYHVRRETIPSGGVINRQKFLENNAAGVIKCKNGLRKLKNPVHQQV